ncbi:MAG: acyl--CoA ligase, partial [Pseudomonadales bacterium]|nr:acyl--CoA ligase [Pseudomonadales bacterium]
MTRSEAIKELTAPGQPYELQEMTIRGNPCRVFVNAPPTLRELVSENRSTETFYVYEDERDSFEDMYQRAARVASVLADEYGIRKGDRVAISMRNYPEWVTAFTAITSIGGIAVALNALWSAEEMEYGLKLSGARVLFADQERLERLARCSDDLQIDVIAVRPSDPSVVSARLFDDIIEQEAQMPESDIHPDDDAIMLYTSGSTGHPKGAVSTHRNVISALLSWELDGAAAALIHQFELPDREYQIATLLGVPLFHVSGLPARFLSRSRTQRQVAALYQWATDKRAERNPGKK